jgi:hypothetical protein
MKKQGSPCSYINIPDIQLIQYSSKDFVFNTVVPRAANVTFDYVRHEIAPVFGERKRFDPPNVLGEFDFVMFEEWFI